VETIERPRPRSGSGSGSQDTLHDDGGESRELCRLHLASRAVRCDALLPPTSAAPRRIRGRFTVCGQKLRFYFSIGPAARCDRCSRSVSAVLACPVHSFRLSVASASSRCLNRLN